MKYITKTSLFSGVFIAFALAILVAMPASTHAQIYQSSPTGSTGSNYSYNHNYNPNPSYYNTYPVYYYSPLSVNCYVSASSANIGDYVTWTANASGGTGSYTYSWSGTDGLSSYGGSVVSKNYSYSGSKTATVTVTASNGTITTQSCGTINIINNNYPYNYPFAVTCSSNSTFSPVGSYITWTAYPSNNNNNYYNNYSYSWSGTDAIYGSQNSISTYYNTPGIKTAMVTVYSNNNQPVTVQCSNAVTIGNPYPNRYYAPASMDVTYTAKVQAPETKQVAVATPTPTVTPTPVPSTNADLSAASLFSLKNVPWGWVAILAILILLGMVFYLMFNRKNM